MRLVDHVRLGLPVLAVHPVDERRYGAAVDRAQTGCPIVDINSVVAWIRSEVEGKDLRQAVGSLPSLVLPFRDAMFTFRDKYSTDFLAWAVDVSTEKPGRVEVTIFSRQEGHGVVAKPAAWDAAGLYWHERLPSGWSLFACVAACAFMHCKNVSMREEAAAPKLERKFFKKHGIPRVRYQVLEIAPLRARLDREHGAGGSVSIAKALHIVRGHFAEYKADKPLFGRPGLHGLFWVPAHVRGDASAGVVVSDYRIDLDAPNGDQNGDSNARSVVFGAGENLRTRKESGR